jgi:hypothetical protein
MNPNGDYGCFFIKIKQPRDVGFIIYIKTNYLLKHHPNNKLNYFDEKTNQMSTKPYTHNKIIYFGFSGKDRVGGISLDEYTIKDFKDIVTKNVEEIYHYTDYPSSEELYNAMNNSKTGISKDFTKKWFEEQYRFIEGQYATFVKKRSASSIHSETKHRRNVKPNLNKTRKQGALRRALRRPPRRGLRPFGGLRPLAARDLYF